MKAFYVKWQTWWFFGSNGLSARKIIQIVFQLIWHRTLVCVGIWKTFRHVVCNLRLFNSSVDYSCKGVFTIRDKCLNRFWMYISIDYLLNEQVCIRPVWKVDVYQDVSFHFDRPNNVFALIKAINARTHARAHTHTCMHAHPVTAPLQLLSLYLIFTNEFHSTPIAMSWVAGIPQIEIMSLLCLSLFFF